jgi:hypothetical protein
MTEQMPPEHANTEREGATFAVRHVANEPVTGSMERELLRALERVRPREVRIATAYLTPDGFLELRRPLEETSSVKLLLGERPFLTPRGPRDILASLESAELAGPSEAIDWYQFLEGDYPWLLMTHDQRKEALEAGLQPDVTKAFNLQAWEKVRKLVGFLQRDGVEVRRFLADQAGKVPEGKVLSHETASRVHLHAKAYLFSGDGRGYAAVGSSNLTKGGLNENVELNLTTEDPAVTTQLVDWFEEKWKQGQDSREEFIHLLEQCVLFGRRFTPWQVFIKALHAAYGRFLDFGLGGELADQLAIFQQEAVARCVQLVNRHWGAMLCDSVGLGKTHEGLGILGEFQRQRQGKTKALVICPAQLESNWSRDKFQSYGVFGETFTMERLPQLAEIDDLDDGLEKARRQRLLRRLQDFDIILVDESHNFRNHEAKRYKGLMKIIREGAKPDKRVVLLTATPINNTIWDLYYQLRLITRGDDTWYAGRGPIANLRTTFQQVDKGGGGPGLLDTMILTLVRRTRHDIRARQAAGEPMAIGDEPLRFPIHEIPEAITYSLEQLYRGVYKEVVDAIENLTFAVYKLEEYGVDTGERDTESRIRQRNETLIGIMRTIFLKRMESSVAALTNTVRSQVDYLNIFLARLDEGRVLTPRLAQKLRVALGGSLTDDALEAEEPDSQASELLARMATAPADADKLTELRGHVGADRDTLSDLLGELEKLAGESGPEGDPKLARLREVLESLPAQDEHGVPTKAVVFTNYRDTANYIFRSLDGPEDAHFDKMLRCWSNLADQRWMSKLTGRDPKGRRAEVLAHFAPLASCRDTEALDDPILLEKVEPYRQESIELLISTDVLSEGQNLQDAQYVINYDLHWNPVRMIQRGGRIDRLFSPHERVFFYNLMPEKELEDILKLVKGLEKKIKTIEGSVALDASILGEQVEATALDQLMAIKRGGEAADKIYLEGERTQGLDQAYAQLNQYIDLVRSIGTEEVRQLPDGIYSVKLGEQSGVFVQLRMPEEVSGEVFWRFYPLEETQPVASPGDVAKLIESERDEERCGLPEEVNPFTYLEGPLTLGVGQLGVDYKAQVAALQPDKDVAHLRRLLSRDDLLEEDPDLWRKLHDWCEQYHPIDMAQRGALPDAIRKLRLLRQNAAVEDAVSVLRELWQALEDAGLDRPLLRPETREPSERELQLVCWELILTKTEFDKLASSNQLE